MAAEEPTLSKSARKRANQKARAAEAAEEAAPPPPAPEPKSKAKAKAAPKAEPAPAPAPEPKAKAKAKAKEAAAPAKAAAPEPKSKAKAQPAPKAEPVPAPKAEAKAKPKPASKQGAKPKKPEPKEEEEPAKKKEEVDEWIQYDDGKGGDWEEASGLSNKQLKQKQRREAKEAMEKELKKAGVSQGTSFTTQHIPGMPTAEQVMVQSKASAKGKAAPQASVAVVSAAAIAEKGQAPVAAAVVDTSVTATVKIPDNKIGWVIGPKGVTIAMIKEKTGVKTVDTSGGVCTIIGEKEAVGLAEHAVKELIEKGFTSLAFENFQEHGVMVHPCHFPNIIGAKGVIIQAIKKEAKCEVGIPEVPKNAKADKKFKITLSGAAQSVELGKEIINAIVDYGHHEVTHPGFIHQEVEVEEWKYKYLIGTKGSEMRHIQNSFHVSVNIPREHSLVKNVVVVGEPRDVEGALKHIEKIMWNADQPKGGRGASEQAIDPWAGDEEVEDWMSPYLYKRK
jgi:rRNA processing protein Krr1/Pno1